MAPFRRTAYPRSRRPRGAVWALVIGTAAVALSVVGLLVPVVALAVSVDAEPFIRLPMGGIVVVATAGVLASSVVLVLAARSRRTPVAWVLAAVAVASVLGACVYDVMVSAASLADDVGGLGAALSEIWTRVTQAFR